MEISSNVYCVFLGDYSFINTVETQNDQIKEVAELGVKFRNLFIVSNLEI